MIIKYNPATPSPIELPTQYSDWRKYTNDLTKELDKYLLDKYKKYAENICGGTYLDGYINNGHLGIRFPGSTRGGIEFDSDGVITKIQMYEDREARAVECYEAEAKFAVQKFIGAKLIFIKEGV